VVTPQSAIGVHSFRLLPAEDWATLACGDADATALASA
jgi:hypothetical protein